MAAKAKLSGGSRQNAQLLLLQEILKPALRAYAFGHVSTTGPKVIGLLLSLIGGKGHFQRQLERLRYIATSSLGPFRFPSFCFSLVGLYSALSILFTSLLRRYVDSRSIKSGHIPLQATQIRIARFLAALLASYVAFPMLNRGDARLVRRRAVSDVPVDPTMVHLAKDPILAAGGHPAVESSTAAVATRASAKYQPGGSPPPPLAGRTLDLTVMAVVRAIETLTWHAWQRKYSGKGANHPSRVANVIASSADPALFISSCFMIMWSWFYAPMSLPASYRRWIGQAAGVDPRLVEVLRKARWGMFVYGTDTGQGYILEGMCRELGLPEIWGEPAVTVPVPCEIVHQGTGESCHWHTIVKFARAWVFSMRMYLPLQLALRLRGGIKGLFSVPSLKRSVLEANRSSTFLATFVALFYYGVCLARTMVGPRLFDLKTVTRQMYDSGLCVGAGSALCGWSILIEPARRRRELALFVAPRAASCLIPTRYERKYLPRERAAFASGVAVLFALGHENPNNVRGILGTLIHAVIG